MSLCLCAASGLTVASGACDCHPRDHSSQRKARPPCLSPQGTRHGWRRDCEERSGSCVPALWGPSPGPAAVRLAIEPSRWGWNRLREHPKLRGAAPAGGVQAGWRAPCPVRPVPSALCTQHEVPRHCKVTSGKLLGTNSSFFRGLAGKIPRSLRNDKPCNCCFITNEMLFPSPALSHCLSLKHPKVVFFFFFF